MIEIRCLDITDMQPEVYEKLYLLCTKERQDKINRYAREEDRRRGIAAHVLMKYGWLESGRKAERLRISCNAYGKPYIQNDETFYFNLSHAGNWVAMAYSDSPVGIDVEQLRKNRGGIAKQFFGEREKKYIRDADSQEEADRRFIQIWTIKESYLKYLGVGLQRELNSFDVEVGEVIQLYDRTGGKPGQLSLFSRQFHGSYYLSVCGAERGIRLRELRAEDLLGNASIG